MGRTQRQKNGVPKVDILPDVDADVPLPPDGMSAVAADVWRRKASELAKTGRLGAQDLEAFATYCQTFEEERRLRAVLKDRGQYQTLDSGRVVKHPAVDDLMVWLRVRTAYEKEFGFTPASRKSAGESSVPTQRVPSRKR